VPAVTTPRRRYEMVFVPPKKVERSGPQVVTWLHEIADKFTSGVSVDI
jgi:hypothetical protein